MPPARLRLTSGTELFPLLRSAGRHRRHRSILPSRQPARAVIPRSSVEALTGRTVPPRLSDTSAGHELCQRHCGRRARIAKLTRRLEVINLGSSQISIGDIAQSIFKVLGGEFGIETDPERVRPTYSEVNRLLAECSKAERLLD